jgi:hypothetical protein
VHDALILTGMRSRNIVVVNLMEVCAMWYHVIMSIRVLGGALVCLLVFAGILYVGMSFSNSSDADKRAEMQMDTARIKRGIPIIVALAVATALSVLSWAVAV